MYRQGAGEPGTEAIRRVRGKSSQVPFEPSIKAEFSSRKLVKWERALRFYIDCLISIGFI